MSDGAHMVARRMHSLPFAALVGLILALAALQAGCRFTGRPLNPASNTLSTGDNTRTLNHDGLERSYIVHIPPGFDPTLPTPVVLVFHGGGGNAKNGVRMTGFNALADAEHFIVVYPNGSGRFKNTLLTWNGGDCCGYAVEKNVDDVGFVRALLSDLSAVVNVDQQRIYATGMSNGAIMSYRLACELSDLIAAIGPVAATQNLAECEPKRPVPVLHIHGDSDQHAPYAGGVGAKSLVGVPFASVDETIAFWVQNNRCELTPQVAQTGNIRHTVYNGCQQNATVELYTVLGGGHTWPGGRPGRPGADDPTMELDATQVIWKFFAAHPKP
jgi:polyhydroxybutyrate depolymerase